MIKLTRFQHQDFSKLISWIDSEELLITIAGTVFTYPLTEEQLQKYLDDDNSHSFNILDVNTNIGHAEILMIDSDMCKIDKLIIGDKSYRGKGLCREIIPQLLAYSFENLNTNIVELNVFDWNRNAIKCYETCGFQRNPQKTQTFKPDKETWTAFNMTIDKDKWLSLTDLR